MSTTCVHKHIYSPPLILQ